MADGPEWFAPKRYGYGAGMPISWQGWAVTVGFVAVTLLLCMAFRDQPFRLVASLVPFVIGFVIVTARTTRGGWRWRWGGED